MILFCADIPIIAYVYLKLIYALHVLSHVVLSVVDSLSSFINEEIEA